jgi:alkanesulfonate monooxygenase SsuD/methylene tetrahydromethanopterin reductase-like flavin-dependent oxidoreductase (luciferase family)
MLSGGRFELGLGTGIPAMHEQAAVVTPAR